MKKTNRNFLINSIKDLDNRECSIQESSLAFESCIWLGVDTHRMHLTLKMANVLYRPLRRFVRTGRLKTKNRTGHVRIEFLDRYNQKCSVEETIEEGEGLWLGVDVDLENKISERMRLNREMAKSLLNPLRRFINTGRLGTIGWKNIPQE